MPRRLALLFLCLTGALAAADFELTGVITSDGQTKLSFRDRRTGSSRWVLVGGTIDGFSVMEFDPTDQSVVLTKGRETLRQKLNDSGPIGAPPTRRSPFSKIRFGKIRPRANSSSISAASCRTKGKRARRSATCS